MNISNRNRAWKLILSVIISLILCGYLIDLVGVCLHELIHALFAGIIPNTTIEYINVLEGTMNYLMIGDFWYDSIIIIAPIVITGILYFIIPKLKKKYTRAGKKYIIPFISCLLVEFGMMSFLYLILSCYTMSGDAYEFAAAINHGITDDSRFHMILDVLMIIGEIGISMAFLQFYLFLIPEIEYYIFKRSEPGEQGQYSNILKKKSLIFGGISMGMLGISYLILLLYSSIRFNLSRYFMSSDRIALIRDVIVPMTGLIIMGIICNQTIVKKVSGNLYSFNYKTAGAGIALYLLLFGIYTIFPPL